MTATTAEDAFRRALEADAGAAGPPAPPPPPARDPDAPFGRDDAGNAIAPHGFKADGAPRLKPPGPGRGGKAAAAADKPRVTAAPPARAASPAAPAVSGRDYREQLDELGEGAWAVMSGVPIPWRRLRIRVQAQAAILRANKPTLVRSCNTIAQHNAAFAARIDALTTGNAAWMLPALFGLAPFVGQSLAMWRSPAAGDIEALAAANEAAFQDMLDAAADQLAREVLEEHDRIREAAAHAQAA